MPGTWYLASRLENGGEEREESIFVEKKMLKMKSEDEKDAITLDR